MNELIDYAQNLISFLERRGGSLNIESQRALGELLQNILQLIEESSQDSVQGLTPSSEVPQLEQGPYPSSNINSFKYNPDNGQLFVKFHGTDSADSGPTYSYQNVPKNIYDVFSQGRVGPKTSGENQYHRWIRGVTPSLGASLNALIKNGGYPYQRVA